MSLFFWKDNKKIDAFASALASDFYSFIQPDQAKSYFEANDKDKKSEKKINSRIDDLIKQIQQFKVSNSTGIYGSARLHLSFTERLKELGYDELTAKKLNEMLMLKAS